MGAGRLQAGRWREEWEKRGFRSRPAPFRWRFTMSKKVLGFTSRKWVAFWWGLICGVVVGGLAVL